MFEAYKVRLLPAITAVDLTDGSERGEYVNQDYILRQLGRPHRCINLMYCYYPNDEGWPERASLVHAHDDVTGAWDYPYDDYFTYKGGIGGNTKGEPFTCMRDVRRHGQDVCLTLTMDPFLDDGHIIAICKDLSIFGRMLVRVNHEATGSWFSFNKRASYEEVAAFFVRVCDIFHEYAPNCKVILCLDGCTTPDAKEMKMEEIFAEAARHADIVSVDRYFALHWGWPLDVCEKDGPTHECHEVSNIYVQYKKSAERYNFLNGGVKKPMVLSELNADGDVVGPFIQTDMFKEFCDMLDADDEEWLSAFTTYMFRDRGRLGLEIEDPNNPEVGIRQPLMDEYIKLIRRERFLPRFKTEEKTEFPAKLRWGGAEDAEGISVPLVLEDDPVFFELYFDEENIDSNLMVEIEGEWFYKAPGVKCIDLTSAFFGNRGKGRREAALNIFAPPASGENDMTQGEDWQENYYYTLKKLPEIRIRYSPCNTGEYRAD